MHSRQKLTSDLRALGVSLGDVVMVHASVRAVGEVAGGPDEIHLAISDAAGPGGTVMMYAGCPQYVDEVGRGNLWLDEEAELLEKLPAFDPQTARSARDHYVEHIADIPGKRVSRFKVPVLEDGRRVWRDMAEFDTSSAGVHPAWPERFFATIVSDFLAASGNTGGRVGDAMSYLIPAADLLAFAQPVMEQTART